MKFYNAIPVVRVYVLRTHENIRKITESVKQIQLKFLTCFYFSNYAECITHSIVFKKRFKIQLIITQVTVNR